MTRWLAAAGPLCVIVCAWSCSAADHAPDAPTVAPTPSPVSTAKELRVGRLDCASSIQTDTGVQSGYQTVLGVVQLPTAESTRALQTSRSAEPPRRYFAKRALIVKPGVSFRLRLIAPSALAPTLGWGSMETTNDVVAVENCSSSRSDRWLSYAGGFEVAKPGCLTVEVQTGSQTRQVLIGVGAACPGQQGPAQPSDS